MHVCVPLFTAQLVNSRKSCTVMPMFCALLASTGLQHSSSCCAFADTKRALAMTSQLLQQAVSTVKQQEAALLACKASDVMDPANAANTPTEVITRGTASVGSYHDALEALPESSDNIAKPLSGTQASGTQVHVSE